MDQGIGEDAAKAARARARHAGNLLQASQFAEALVQYDWLWRHLHHDAPEMGGVRVSFMAGEMGHLCRRFPPAQAHFEAIRDQAESNLDAAGTAGGFEPRLDWMVLNEVLGQADRTLTWFDTVKVDDLSESVVSVCIPRLVPLLRRRGRWAEIGRLFRDPLAKIREDHAMMVQANALTAGRAGFGRMTGEDLRKDLFREQTSVLYRGLRAAGRAAEAEAVRLEAQALDDSSEMREILTIDSVAPNADPLPQQ